MDAVIRGEEDIPADGDRGIGEDRLRAFGARIDVADQLRPGIGAVGTPELVAVDAIVGEEHCGPAEVAKRLRGRVGRPAVDVAYEGRAARRRRTGRDEDDARGKPEARCEPA